MGNKYELLDTKRIAFGPTGLDLSFEVCNDDSGDTIVVQGFYDGYDVVCATTCRVIDGAGKLVGEGKTSDDLIAWLEIDRNVRRSAIWQRDVAIEMEQQQDPT